MNVHCFRHPEWLTNTYLITLEQHGLLIDAGCSPEEMGSITSLSDLSLAAILLTHTHGDHTCGLKAWLEYSSAPLVTPEALGHDQDRQCVVIQHADFSFGPFEVRALLTPGHTPHHLCFMVKGLGLFTGDLLFRHAVGGTVGFGPGGVSALTQSIEDHVLSAPDDTVLFPGHMNSSRVDEERANNPFLRALLSAEHPAPTPCKVRGEPAQLLFEGTDYDGGSKAWIRYDASQEEFIVPGSWLER